MKNIPKHEREALLALYYSTNGDYWDDNFGWLTDASESEWKGVTVEGGHVVEIDLKYNNLTGTIPSALGNLSSLQELDLFYNQLSGEIPSALGNLSNLQELYLASNQLTGKIPSALGNLSSLQELYLYSNQLSGEIPSALGNLSSLQELYLNHNQLSGEIPSELINLSLNWFYFHNTNLKEPQTTEFQNWLEGIRFLKKNPII